MPGTVQDPASRTTLRAVLAAGDDGPGDEQRVALLDDALQRFLAAAAP